MWGRQNNTIIQITSAHWSTYEAYNHLPDSKAWHSETVRPSLAVLAISATYWGREEDLNIEYSLVFYQNVYLMLARFHI